MTVKRLKQIIRKRRKITMALVERTRRSRKRLARRRRQLARLRRPTRTSGRGLDLIAEFEGFVDHVYLDPAGIPTIGFGHVVKAGESFPTRISRERGLKLLAQDARIAENAVKAAVKVRLNQAEFDALVSFTYNVGGGALADSTLVRKLNAGDRRGAADEFLRWTLAGGRVLPGLIRRRRAERALFLG